MSRFPNGIPLFTAAKPTQLAFATVVALAAHLVTPDEAHGSDAVVTFNELQYHPIPEEPEWVEFFNQMSIRIDLSGWRISGGIDYIFPEGTVIDPGAYLVVHGNPGTIPNALGPFSGQCDNAGETVRLRDRNDRIMDELRYGDDSPWPVGPDGSGFTLAKRHPSHATARPSSWATSLAEGGSPGAPNLIAPGLGHTMLSEVTEGFVELRHTGATEVLLDGFTLRGTNGPSKAQALDGIRIASGERLVVESPLSKSGSPLFLIDDANRLIDTVRVLDRPRGRWSEADDLSDPTWYFTESWTPGASNHVTLQHDIVIHEIMYHFPPLYDQPGTVENDYAERREEWIELYNRSESTIDLSGWTIGGGIRYRFPENTLLHSDAYLVVARDAAALAAKYPDITVMGDFSGKLGNSSDVIQLSDHRGNPADEVTYFDSGRWPRFADGGGSSLELRDPWADNATPEAWRASREENKAEWVTLHYQGRATSPVRSNNPSNFHEFLMGLLGAGEALIDDVSVIADPDGTALELMKNGDFQGRNIFSGAVTDWRMLGTHAASNVEEDPAVFPSSYYLRLKADGAIEHTYNNVSSSFPPGQKIEATQTYAISLRAKWVAGSPQLNTRLYLNRLAKTHILPIPELLGTPGSTNSWSFQGNIGPTMSDLSITPLAPRALQPITVSIQARDEQGVDRMLLWYRTASGDWHNTPMLDLGGNHYQSQIPGQSNGTVFQLYVEATDGEGGSSFFPAGGPDSRALLRVGTPPLGDRTVNDVRLLILPEEHAFMRRAEHAVSNGRIGGTLIANGEDYHFDVGVRLRSSPYGRRSNRTGYNIVLGKEHPYRGVHDSISIDRGNVMPNGNSSGFFEVTAGAGVNELVCNQIAQRARGIPTTYEDVIFIETPNLGESSLAQVRMARYGAPYLDGQYENGAQGATHKFELIYHPTNTVDGRTDGLKGPYVTVRGIDIQDMRDDKEAYRFNFIPTNNRDRDDFSGIIRLGDAFSSRTDTLRRQKIPQAIDVDQWMRTFAFESLIGVADVYNMGLEHNLVLYTRPSDGRVLAFPWDLDHAFYYSPNASLLGRGGTNLARFINLPENQRLFYGHLDDIIETAFDIETLRPWITHLNDVTEHRYDDRFLTYIQRRADHVRSELKKAVSSLFQITTNQGNPLESDASSLLLEGHGWVDVRALRLESTGELLDLTWTGLNTWQAEVPLKIGDNTIKVQAIDFQGEELGSFFSPGSDSITVTHTGTVEAAAAGNFVISEIHYHPAGAEAWEEASEFIELLNTGSHPVDLAGIEFTRGLNWRAPTPDPLVLEPGATALLVHDVEAFERVHGTDHVIIGSFPDSRLSNAGETLRLEDRAGGLIHEVTYQDDAPWPEIADGKGHSIIYRGEKRFDFSAWRPSLSQGGSPGIDERQSYDGETPLLAYASTASNPLTFNSMGQLSLFLRSTADDLQWSLEGSQDLETWEVVPDTHSTNLDRQDDPQDDSTTLTWANDDAYAFYRVRFEIGRVQ